MRLQNVFTLGVLVILMLVGGTHPAYALMVTGVGQASIDDGGKGVHELSGLTFIGPVTDQPNTYRYFAVSNSQQKMYGMDVQIDPSTGAITSAKVTSTTALIPGTDLEGIAYNSERNSVYVSDEVGPAIREYSLAGGALMQTLTVPPVFTNVRTNRGFEALSLQSGGKSLWTANEEALTIDGDLSTINSGTVVRLLKYNPDLTPAGQWAYKTDSIENDFPDDKRELSGISDIAVLPDGTILVLEREIDAQLDDDFTPVGQCRLTIYQVDFSGSSDISSFTDGLKGKKYIAVKKTRLWQSKINFQNYEGLCLGPKLNDGTYSLIMCADDQTGKAGFEQKLYALKISGVQF